MDPKHYLAGLAAGAMVLVGTVGTALAADPTPTAGAAARTYCQAGPLGAGGHFGWGGGFAALDSVAKLLNLPVAEIAAERQAGTSLAAIARAKGVGEDQLVASILTDRKGALDAWVKAGALTAEQEKLMLDRMETRVRAAVERATTGHMGPGEGFGLGVGPGGREMHRSGGAMAPGQGMGMGHRMGSSGAGAAR